MAKRRIQVTLREAAELPDIVFGQPTTARRIVGGPTDAETRVVTIRKESEPSET